MLGTVFRLCAAVVSLSDSAAMSSTPEIQQVCAYLYIHMSSALSDNFMIFLFLQVPDPLVAPRPMKVPRLISFVKLVDSGAKLRAVLPYPTTALGNVSPRERSIHAWAHVSTLVMVRAVYVQMAIRGILAPVWRNE